MDDLIDVFEMQRRNLRDSADDILAMEPTELPINEEQARTLIEAYRILRKAFPEETAEFMLELIELCRKNDGLLVAAQSSMVMGYFRYNPGDRVGERKMLDIVVDYDIETLKKLDLRTGQILHVVGFTSPKGHGYKILRSFLRLLNARGYSTHRIEKGKEYFALYRNTRYREAPHV